MRIEIVVIFLNNRIKQEIKIADRYHNAISGIMK